MICEEYHAAITFHEESYAELNRKYKSVISDILPKLEEMKKTINSS